MVKKRIYSYDIMRIVAAAAVVMVHVTAPYAKQAAIGSAEFVAGTVFGSLSRLGVQFFVMISGALILCESREYTAKTMFKSIRNLLFVLAAWSLFYATVHPLVLGQKLTFQVFVNRFFAGHYHLWYLFMLIGLHVITPILRLLTKKQNAKIVLYYIALVAIFEFAVPVFNFFYQEFGGTNDLVLTYTEKFRFGIFGHYTAYYLLGWYLTTVELTAKMRKLIYCGGAIGFFVIVAGTLYYSTETYRAYPVFYQNYSVQTMLYSIAAFVFLHHRFGKWTPKKEASKTILMKISALTFGVYVLHVFFLNILTARYPWLVEVGGEPIPILLTWTLVTAVSLLVSYLISKIPFVKAIIKC